MKFKDSINEIVEKMKNEISFIEIKEGTEIKINNKDILIDKKISFPIFMDELIKNIKESEDFKGFNNKSIIEGILFTIGTDKSFKLNETYKSILIKAGINIEAYLIKLINSEEVSIDKKIVYAKALIENGKMNEKKYFIYGNVLEMKGTELFNKNKKNLAEEYMEESVKYYNKSLDENLEFSLPYYKLGYYYKQNNEYLNAKAYWDKFIELDENDIRKQEIRDQMEELEYYIKFEEGYKLVLKGYVEQGLDILLPLLDVFKNWWKLFFVIGVAFRQKQEFDVAKRYFKNVVEINPAQVDAINELAVCEMSTDNYENALKYIDEGLKTNPKSHELYTNRAAANIYLKDLERAEKDVKKALEIEPGNEVATILSEEIEKIKKQG